MCLCVNRRHRTRRGTQRQSSCATACWRSRRRSALRWTRSIQTTCRPRAAATIHCSFVRARILILGHGRAFSWRGGEVIFRYNVAMITYTENAVFNECPLCTARKHTHCYAEHVHQPLARGVWRVFGSIRTKIKPRFQVRRRFSSCQKEWCSLFPSRVLHGFGGIWGGSKQLTSSSTHR